MEVHYVSWLVARFKNEFVKIVENLFKLDCEKVISFGYVCSLAWFRKKNLFSVSTSTFHIPHL
jgi:hypothetical protein